MPRLAEQDRPKLIAVFLAHWNLVDQELGSPLLLTDDYGRAELAQQREQYEELRDEIARLKCDRISAAGARDVIWEGGMPNDPGIAGWLRMYPTMVRARLGAGHPQSRLLPRMGEITVERYLESCDRVLTHWQDVNAELPAPMTIGLYRIEDLTAARTDLAAQIAEIERSERELRRAIEERERLFGDVAEDRRSDGTIISRLLLYRVTVQAMLHGQPLGKTLPALFPKVKDTRRPEFRWDFSRDEAGVLKTRLENPGLEKATEAYLTIGGVRLTQPLPEKPGDEIELTWLDAPADAEPEKLNLRNARHYVVARGRAVAWRKPESGSAKI